MLKQKISLPNSRYQAMQTQGAALIVGLVLLLTLTVLGVSSITTTNLETKMSANYRDRTIAFQAAEAALREAEEFVKDSILLDSQFGGSNAWLYTKNNGPKLTDAFNTAWWTGVASQTYAGTPLDGVSTQPHYIVELRGPIENKDANAAINISGYGESTGAGTLTTYRVTARGTGRTDSSQVILQSYYGKLL